MTTHEGSSCANGILLHGFGANEHDLAPIAQNLSSVGNWTLPRAPLFLGPESYAWFPFSVDEMPEFDLSLMSDIDYPGLIEASEALRHEYAGMSRPLVIAGFSQGSMLALELAHRMRPDALVLFSSALIAAKRWRKEFTALKGMPIFQTHGRVDTVLPYENAEALAALLRESGALLEFTAFEGGHSIPAEILSLLNGWLENLFCKPPRNT